MARSVNPSIYAGGAQHIYDIFYLYGFTSAFVTYIGLSHFFPAKETLIEATIHEDVDVISGVEYKNDGVHTPYSIDGQRSEQEEKGVHSKALDL